MLTNMKEMLEVARKQECAVAHFNINNLEWTKYILEVSKETNTSLILGVSESAIKYMGGYKTVYYMVYGLIQDLKINIPVVLHLDHGKSFLSCKNAIDAGFSSVMIDGSKDSFEKNIEVTREVVEYARKRNVTVEAELGVLGEEKIMTDVDQAFEFVMKTNVDALAPSVGNAHGLYKRKVRLDVHRIQQIAEKIKIPLVLHGGTGIPDSELSKAIKSGICKINFNTELQVAWSKEVRKYLNHCNEYDPRKIISSGEMAIKEKIKEKLNLLKSRTKER